MLQYFVGLYHIIMYVVYVLQHCVGLNHIIMYVLYVLQHFEPDTEDLGGLCWSPDGRVLAVWETCLQVSLWFLYVFIDQNSKPSHGIESLFN